MRTRGMPDDGARTVQKDAENETLTEESRPFPSAAAEGGADPWLGRRLLKYHVEEILGQGGMSVVYRARDEQLQRVVALKILHPFLAQKEECQARLVREAQAVARLKHPNILEVFNYADHQSVPQTTDGAPRPSFVVAEYVPGVTLKTFLEQTALSGVPEAAALITLVLARALAHAHERGVIHRDLKPENVMVREDGVLKLMDFGIAHIVDQQQLTVTGTLLGSPAHMAPECIEGHPADARSDLFSLGTMLYWMTTGHLPFAAPTPHALLRAIVEADCLPAQARSPRISDGLAGILSRAMAKNPGDRFASAREFADALESFLRDGELDASDACVEALLRSPKVEIARLGEQVRASQLQKARQALEDGAPARAIAALSRVIAADATDPEAHELLEAAHDFDEPAPALSPRPEPKENQSDASTMASTQNGRQISGAGPVAILGLIIVLIVSAVGVSRWVDSQQDGASGAALLSTGGLRADGNPADRVDLRDAKAIPASEAETPTPGASNQNPEEPTANPGDDVREVNLQARPKTPRKSSAKVAAGLALNRKGQTKRASAEKRSVQIRVWPFADIYVDGEKIATQVPGAEVGLAPGQHWLRFTHPFAKTQELSLRVPATGKLGEVRVRLDEAKPAFIRVEAEPGDAEVAVAGTPKGSAAKSLKAPIIVPFPSLRAESTFEILVFKKGYRTRTISQNLRAGGTTTVRVVLEPETNGPIEKPSRVPLGTQPVR